MNNIEVFTNMKGHYQVSALVEGRQRKRSIKHGTEEFLILQKYEVGQLSETEVSTVINQIFNLQ